MPEFSKIPIAEVKQAWADTLAGISPLSDIHVHPAWPGPDLLYVPEKVYPVFKAVVWFGPSTPSYERHSMRADRQRRICTVTFPVLIEVLAAGESNEGGLQALAAESYAYELWEAIDVHVADEKFLSSPGIVNKAWVDGENAEAGFTDTGYGYRLSMPIIAEFRLL